MERMILVSAIFPNGPDSLTGGRGRGLRHFLPSLLNIARLECPLVLYTPAQDVQHTQNTLAPHFRWLEVIPWDLALLPHHAELMAWKAHLVGVPGFLNDRNHALCLSKPLWLKDAMNKGYFRTVGDGAWFWMDAGLTHHGIFPERVGGVELLTVQPASRYHPLLRESLFTPAAGRHLGARARESRRVLVLSMPWQGVEDAAFQALGVPLPQQRVVGGFFGGGEAPLKGFISAYCGALDVLAHAGAFTLEETVFSALHARHPEQFKAHAFGTWWFHSPGEPNSFLTQEGASFYKAFAAMVGRGTGFGSSG